MTRILMLVAAAFLAVTVPAVAQTPAAKRGTDKSDPCAGQDPRTMAAEDTATCAQDAIWSSTPAVVIKWSETVPTMGAIMLPAEMIGDAGRCRGDPHRTCG